MGLSVNFLKFFLLPLLIRSSLDSIWPQPRRRASVPCRHGAPASAPRPISSLSLADVSDSQPRPHARRRASLPHPRPATGPSPAPNSASLSRLKLQVTRARRQDLSSPTCAWRRSSSSPACGSGPGAHTRAQGRPLHGGGARGHSPGPLRRRGRTRPHKPIASPHASFYFLALVPIRLTSTIQKRGTRVTVLNEHILWWDLSDSRCLRTKHLNRL